MGETSCVVFVNGDVIIFKGKGKIILPEELASFPYMLSNDEGTKVLIEQPINNESNRLVMRSCILRIIEKFRESGVPRIEFPRWNEMLIFPVTPESAEEEYWCPEQVVDSFLDLYGPEFIL